MFKKPCEGKKRRIHTCGYKAPHMLRELNVDTHFLRFAHNPKAHWKIRLKRPLGGRVQMRNVLRNKSPKAQLKDGRVKPKYRF